MRVIPEVWEFKPEGEKIQYSYEVEPGPNSIRSVFHQSWLRSFDRRRDHRENLNETTMNRKGEFQCVWADQTNKCGTSPGSVMNCTYHCQIETGENKA